MSGIKALNSMKEWRSLLYTSYSQNQHHTLWCFMSQFTIFQKYLRFSQWKFPMAYTHISIHTVQNEACSPYFFISFTLSAKHMYNKVLRNSHEHQKPGTQKNWAKGANTNVCSFSCIHPFINTYIHMSIVYKYKIYGPSSVHLRQLPRRPPNTKGWTKLSAINEGGH